VVSKNSAEGVQSEGGGCSYRKKKKHVEKGDVPHLWDRKRKGGGEAYFTSKEGRGWIGEKIRQLT